MIQTYITSDETADQAAAHDLITRVLHALWTGTDLDETQIIDLLQDASGLLGQKWQPPPSTRHPGR